MNKLPLNIDFTNKVVVKTDAEELLGATLLLRDDRSVSAITDIVLPIDCGFAAYSEV